MSEEEGIWIPGARFEAMVNPDRTVVQIGDLNFGTVFTALDRTALVQIREAAKAIKRAMEWKPFLHASTRFVAHVSKNRTRADIKDLEAGDPSKDVFMLLNETDIDELIEMTSVLREILEAARW